MIPWGTGSSEAIHQAPVPPIDRKVERGGQAHVCGSSGAASPRDQCGPWLSEPSLPSLKAAIRSWKP